MIPNSNDGFLFMHLPKTAGYSVRMLLASLFPQGEVSGNYPVTPMPATDAEELDQHRVIVGHISWEDVAAYFPARILFTFLREPIDRCLSVYGFFRQQVERPLIPLGKIQGLNNADEATSLARQLSPEDFFRSDHPHIRQNVENRMAWQLAYRAGIEQRGGLDAAEVLLRAKKNLNAFSFVGLYERIPEEMPRLLSLLGLPNTHQLPLLNQTKKRLALSDISARTREVIERLTELDRAVYEWALRR